jgi:putative SOS response-associated peptidase YedK
MLTMPPGPDIAPCHDRQIAILNRADWPRGSNRRSHRKAF